MGNKGSAKKLAALKTKYFSKILCIGNIVSLFASLYFLVRAFTFRTGGHPEIVYKSKVLDFNQEGSIHIYDQEIMIQTFRSVNDYGEFLWFNTSEIAIAEIDTGMSHFVGIRSKSHVLFLASHACEGESGKEGLLVYMCQVYSNEKLHSCKEVCVTSNDIFGLHFVSFQAEEVVSITEFYRTKNSIGFGVTYTEEHIVDARFVRNSTYELDLELHSSAKSNAQTKYYIPWQDVISYYLLIDILINSCGRLMACPTLWSGVKIRKTRVLVKADLVGGLFTSPGRNFIMFLFTVFTGAQSFLFLDVGLYPHTSISDFWSTAMIASFSSLILTLMFRQSEFRFNATGTILLVLSTAARFISFNIVQTSAQSALRSLGQVVERDCAIYDIERDLLGTVTCNIADGVGMSGLEIFYVVFFEPFFITMMLLVAFELLVAAFRALMKLKYRNPARVGSLSSIRSGSGRNRFSGIMNKSSRKSSGKTTIQGLSEYDKCILLGKLGNSVFSRAWASPIYTVLGKFTHASTFIEDDLVMYGPLLIRINSFFFVSILGLLIGKRKVVETLVHYRAYLGVLVDEGRLASRIENGATLNPYLMEYNYKDMPTFINGEPLH